MLTPFHHLPMSLPAPEPSSAAALLKIAVLLATGLSVHLSLSPPNPPPLPGHCIAQRTLFERAIRWVTLCSKTMVWLATTCDALATAAHAFPSLGLFTPTAALLGGAPALATLHPLLLLGAVATMLGAALRLACFRALGALFTFELAIAPGHTLVTWGPYGVVRHPSYAGVFLTLLGASAAMLAPGAWFRECALRAAAPPMAGAAWAAFAFWTAKVAYALRSTHRRVATEDGELRRLFGKTWDVYAARVRWRLVPGVY